MESDPAKRNFICLWLLQAARDAGKAFQLIKEQHLEQLPMHEFPVRIRAQLLWAWARLDEAEASARMGIELLSTFQPQQQLQCWRC